MAFSSSCERGERGTSATSRYSATSSPSRNTCLSPKSSPGSSLGLDISPGAGSGRTSGYFSVKVGAKAPVGKLEVLGGDAVLQMRDGLR